MTIEYVMVMHDGDKATKFMSEGYCKDLMEQLAAAQSQEVCTVAHENVETCGYCQRDALTAESAALRDERALIIQRAEKAEAALVEAEALRETRAKELSYVVEACTAALVIRTTHESRDALRDLRAWATNRIDAHLARKP